MWALVRLLLGYGLVMLSAATDAASPSARVPRAGLAVGDGAGAWNVVSTTESPTARAFHTAVWTGSEMLIWGGGPASDPRGRDGPGSGGRYDPATNAWQPVATEGAPSQRAFAAAIWTGDVMIVWGGVVSASFRDDGGQYDPRADTWAPVARIGPDGGRAGHTAAWSGDELLIWGGAGISPSHEQGAAYRPRTRAWAPLPDARFLPMREGHTATWTGDRMLVWGGLTTSGLPRAPQVPLGDGGEYWPSAQAWTPMSTIAAPAPRYGHTAVWTGKEMIIWGGEGGDTSSPTYYGDGAAYNPATKTWRALPAPGAPSPRALHTAIWTGAEMLVWGGENGQGALGDGAAYNPATDAWRALPAPGGLSPRSHHTAVWTGKEMIIWGGCADCRASHFVPLGDGAAYIPPRPILAPQAPATGTSAVGLPTTGGGAAAVAGP